MGFRKTLIFAVIFMIASLSQAELSLQSGHVRAMPPGQPNTAVFMVLTNASDKDITLVSAHTSSAQKAEFHTHIKDSAGVMKMRSVDSIMITAGSQFEFKSGAHHVMLMGLHSPLTPQQTVDLTLTDSAGHTFAFSLPVKSLMAEQGHHHHHHH